MDGKRTGYGIQYTNSLCTIIKYKGEFLNNKFHGNGELFNYNGDLIYEGRFVNGKYYGKGKLYSSTITSITPQLIYEGNFTMGKSNGYGTIYNSDGKIRYTGNIKFGDIHGKGNIYSDTFIIVGEFSYSILRSCSLYMKDGRHYTGKIYRKVDIYKNIDIELLKNMLQKKPDNNYFQQHDLNKNIIELVDNKCISCNLNSLFESDEKKDYNKDEKKDDI